MARFYVPDRKDGIGTHASDICRAHFEKSYDHNRAYYRNCAARHENCPLILAQMTMLPKRTLVSPESAGRESEQAARKARPPGRGSERAACVDSAKEPVGIRYQSISCSHYGFALCLRRDVPHGKTF